ncbi:MAG TPA: alkaline phosphatase family protein [Gaiellales bacterium]|nr:alkaline phosphatase family protein [Gaiellales bacterium]
MRSRKQVRRPDAGPTIPRSRPTRGESMSAKDDLRRLKSIKHVVVLMMENRSFDHMLGYLSLPGGPMPEVDGLKGNESNKDAKGKDYPVFEFPADRTAFHKPGQPLEESLDPCHAPDCVAEQLAGGNGGFVKNFIAKKKPSAKDRGLVMGYFTGTHLPVYDHLARNYCVCDKWHSSVPGDTWPNRLYSLAGHEAETITASLGGDVASGLGVFGQFAGTTVWPQLKNIPIYDVEAFTRQLHDDQWRWYSHDPATLRAADEHYRQFALFDRPNFSYFNKKGISLGQQAADFPILVEDSFLDDAVQGKLRDVSWIDPNFINLRTFDSNSNDDHPPADVRAGQALVLDLYSALVNSPAWKDTLLVITYDEHGGFYDHVPPPKVSDGKYKTYGVRVPALVIGPRVKKGVSKVLFDHTTLIKTILLRFADNPAKAVAALGPRVAAANHLGAVLGDAPRNDIPDHGDLHTKLDAWRLESRQAHAGQAAGLAIASDGAGHPLAMHEFQRNFAAFALTMRALGLPAGRP